MVTPWLTDAGAGWRLRGSLDIVECKRSAGEGGHCWVEERDILIVITKVEMVPTILFQS
jgi:hypothetical protein